MLFNYLADPKIISILALSFIFWRRRRVTGNAIKIAQNVVIIGASSGIGKEIAFKYASRGYNLILVARRLPELMQVLSECKQLSSETSIMSVFEADMGTNDGIRRCADYVKSKFEKCDILVLCAGVISILPFDQLSDGTIIDKIFNINAIGPIKTTAAFLPMLKNSKGRIVVVSSAAGVMAAPTRSLYASTKHAINGFFNSLRIEMESKGVGVTIAMPGSVNTDLRSLALDKCSPAIDKQQKNVLSAHFVADKIIKATDDGDSDVYLPSYYRLAAALRFFFPEFIDGQAKKKYNY